MNEGEIGVNLDTYEVRIGTAQEQAWEDAQVILTFIPKATSTDLGGAKINDKYIQSTAPEAHTQTRNRTYGVQFDLNEQLVVNVPWTDSKVTITDLRGME